MEVATAAGTEVVAAASIIDRGNQSGRLNVPFFSLVKLEVPVYEPESCSVRPRRARRQTRLACLNARHTSSGTMATMTTKSTKNKKDCLGVLGGLCGHRG